MSSFLFFSFPWENFKEMLPIIGTFIRFLIFFKKIGSRVGLEKHPIFKENLSHKRKKIYNAKENKS